MPRFKPYSYDQMKFVPIDFKNQLQEGTFEFALNHIIDEMDLSPFHARFHNDATGASAYDPAILLKVVLFAYSRGITSSRDIERACRENVVFMALSADSHPHFTTIADFISSMRAEVTPLFRSVLLICSQEGLIGKQMFAIDGCKISSNCSKEWSGTRADFERKKGKLERSIALLLRKHRAMDESEDQAPEMRQKEEASIERLRAKVKKIEGFLATHEDKPGRSGRAKQSNITDNESAKMPSGHGVIQGYNGLAAVDSKHQVIVHAEAFGEGHEGQLLRPMLDGIRESFAGIGEPDDVLRQAVVVADNGYHSAENVQMVEEEGIEAYLPDHQYRRRDPAFTGAEEHKRSIDRKKTSRRAKYFRRSDFTYDAATQTMTCPAGKEMYLSCRNYRSRGSYRGVTFMGRTTHCRVCAIRSQCLRNPQAEGRQVTVMEGRDASGEKTALQRMRDRIDTARGRFLYSRRMGIIEPVFGHIRDTLELDWFSLRGKIKVDIQWKLFSIVHNIRKISRFGPRFANG
jgi:transposase